MNSLQDLAESVRAVLVDNGYEKAFTRRLSRQTCKEGIYIHKISDIAAKADLTRAQEHTCIYQIVVVDQSERTAMETCFDLSALLEGLDIESVGGGETYEEQEVYTSPQELQLGANLLFAWETRLSTTYRR